MAIDLLYSTPMDLEPLFVLLLAGGESSRMGTPKHSLCFPNGELLGQRMLNMLSGCGQFQKIVISCRTRDQANDFERFKQDAKPTQPIVIILDDSDVAISRQGVRGPVAGMLGAHRRYPNAYWLILACDYALVRPAAFAQLRANYQEPVTCFKNASGYCEPLVGIWSPAALHTLDRNCKKGFSGPSHTVRQIGNLVEPEYEGWLFNVNTPQDWHTAIEQPKFIS